MVDRDAGDHNTPVAEIGHRLDLARQRAGLTYRDLEARTGLPRSTLHTLLRGRKRLPDYWVLVGLVSSLGGDWDADGWEPLWRRAAEHTAPRPAEAPSPAPETPMPRQLPPALVAFAGRLEALAELDRVLGAERSVAAVVGPGGIGKTSVALQWAHRHQDDFPDGQLFADLDGFSSPDGPRAASAVLAGFLGALGVPPTAVPRTTEEQSGLYRSLLADRRMLVVLDNAGDSEQVLPMLPGTASSAVLLTSRVRLPTLAAHGARLVALEMLSLEESRALLASHLGEDRLAEDPRAVDVVVEACGGLPLALAVVAARAAARREQPLRALAEELTDAEGRLDALTAFEAGADVRAVLSWSYRQLAPEEARVLRLLGAVSLPDLSVEAIAALAGVRRPSAARAVRRLADAHLVEERGSGRYGMHELVRLAAVEWAAGDEPDESVESAVTRLLRWLLATADAADRQLAPQRRHALAEAVVAFADYDAALRWCRANHHLLPAAVQLATTDEQRALVWPLPRALWSYYRLGSDWPEFVEISAIAWDAARALDDVDGQASARNSLGIGHGHLGDLDEAVTHIEAALELFGRLGDRYAQRTSLNNLSDLLLRQGRPGESAERASAAAEICRELDDPYGECLAVGNLGLAHLDLGRSEEALGEFRTALAIAERIEDRDLQVELLGSIADLDRASERLDEAAAAYRRVVELAETTGARMPHAAALAGLAELADDPADVRRNLDEADALLDELAGTDSEELRGRVSELRERCS